MSLKLAIVRLTPSFYLDNKAFSKIETHSELVVLKLFWTPIWKAIFWNYPIC